MAIPGAAPFGGAQAGQTGLPGQPGQPGQRRTSGQFAAAGVLLLLFGVAVIGWIVYDFKEFSELSAGDFLQALVDPRIYVEQELFTPQVWAMTAVMLVVGVLALAQRPGARGAAVCTAVVMLVVSARELVGLATSDAYRDHWIGGNDLDALIIGSWVACLLIALVVGILMLAAGEAGPRQTQPGGPTAVAGALFLLLGVVEVAWIVRQVYVTKGFDFTDYLHALFDASGSDTVEGIIGPYLMYQTVFSLGMLLVGVLLLARRRAALGAAVVLAVVQIYLDVRTMIGYTLGTSSPPDSGSRWYPSWSLAGANLEGKLSLATITGEALFCAVVVVLALVAASRAGVAAPPPVPGWQPQFPAAGYAPYQPNPYQDQPNPYQSPPHPASPPPGFPPPQGGFGAPPAPPAHPPTVGG